MRASVRSSLGTGVALALALDGPGTPSASPLGEEGIYDSANGTIAGAGVADDLEEADGDNLCFLDMTEWRENASQGELTISG